MLKKYEFIEKIGSGAFSSVYSGKHRLTNEPVAIKIENIENECTLRHEGKILLYLSGTKGVPNIRAFGVEGKHRFLVMDLYEKSLNNIINLKPEQKKYIFDTIIEIIKNIHEKMIIHRDIKPANFMLRRSKIFLIDFGLSTVFKRDPNDGRSKRVEILRSRNFVESETQQNRNFVESEVLRSSSIIGTPKYISTFIHEGYEPAPCDDFISAIYVGLFLWRDGKLPWDDCGNNHTEIYREKKSIIWKSDEKQLYEFYRTLCGTEDVEKYRTISSRQN